MDIRITNLPAVWLVGHAKRDPPRIAEHVATSGVEEIMRSRP